MAKSVQPDSLFQICIKSYPEAFGIENPEKMETQKRYIVPESVNIDATIVFSDEFDFTKLADRIFPFLGQDNVIEYKGLHDALSLMSFCQYMLTELGLISTYFLSRKREDRTERVSLSQKAAEIQWQRLKKRGAKHSCCAVIVSTADPKGLRENFGFEPVDTYDHLSGALHHLSVFQNKLVGDLATYIVVVNDLPVHPKNAPLLLLSTGKKLTEFLAWLLETHNELTLLERENYLSHLVKYSLIENREDIKNMSTIMDHTDFVIEMLTEDQPEERRLEIARTALRVNSPMEMAQMALQVDSPTEAALSFIHSEEEMNQLIELFRQRNAAQSETS